MKNPCMFQRGSAPIDWSIDRTIASFRRILHAARQIDVQREDDRPGRRLDPADPPADLRDTRLPSGLCPQDPIAPGLDDHDILDQTLMLDLERKLVSIQFSQEIHLFHG